jgi:hypothetical protein
VLDQTAGVFHELQIRKAFRDPKRYIRIFAHILSDLVGMRNEFFYCRLINVHSVFLSFFSDPLVQLGRIDMKVYRWVDGGQVKILRICESAIFKTKSL